jgi:predicted ATPase/DNA-binding SARP family transcriptional activator
MRFAILGPVQVWAQERQLSLGGPRQLALLAFLVLHANRAVSSDALIDALWGGAASGGDKRVQMAIARLRKALDSAGEDGVQRVRTVSGGYLLAIERGELDADEFRAAVREGREALDAGDPADASTRLRDALELWRGPALAEVAFADFAQHDIRQLDEVRLGALESRIEADLQLGRHAEVISELEGLLVEQPAREPVAGQLMLALYRCGRQADALAVYQRTRAHLIEELGLEPGPALKTLQAQILGHNPTLQAQSLRGPHEQARASDPRESSDESSEERWPARLPPVPTPTIGRQDELRGLVDLLEGGDARIVSVTGPGGVGKTRLALALGHALASALSDGVCWVELAGVGRAEDVGSTIVRGLGLAPLPGETSADALNRYLARRQLLLVLDNFEHVLDAASLLAALHASCPRVAILVTSREPLGLSAEHRFALGPLAVPAADRTVTVAEIEAADAGALFLQAMRRQDTGFELTPSSAPAAAWVCARLDGLPLALELAAAQAGLLGVEELARRLDNALTALGTGPQDAPARQHTLQATIDWSYQLLDPEQAVAFVRFAVFAGGATLSAAAAVTGASLHTLLALNRKNLIDSRGGAGGTRRFMMLETIREYAHARLAQDPASDDVRRRHLDHYLQMAEREILRLWTRDEPEALQALDRESDNFHTALSWALEHEPAAALRLAGQLGLFWNVRADSDGLAWLEAALSSAGGDAPAGDRARAHLGVAYQLSARYQHEQAREAVGDAIALYRRAGDHGGVSLALEHMSLLCRHAGDIAQARANAHAACRHARMAGDDGLLGRTLSRLAESATGSERRSSLEQAAELLAPVGDHRGMAMAWTYNAYEALIRGDLREANGLLSDAQRAMARVDSPYLAAIMWGNIGLAKLFSGDPDQARAAFATQLQLCAQHALAVPACEGLAGMAAVAAANGLDEVAAQLRGSSRAMGYPSSFDEPIESRLSRHHFAPARKRYGASAWHRAEQAGAALSLDEAVAYAREHSDVMARDPRTSSEPPAPDPRLRAQPHTPRLDKPRARARRPST